MDEKLRDRDERPDDDEPKTMEEENEKVMGARAGRVGAEEEKPRQSTGPGGIQDAGKRPSEGGMA
jgi:hypothetical protein